MALDGLPVLRCTSAAQPQPPCTPKSTFPICCAPLTGHRDVIESQRTVWVGRVLMSLPPGRICTELPLFLGGFFFRLICTKFHSSILYNLVLGKLQGGCTQVSSAGLCCWTLTSAGLWSRQGSALPFCSRAGWSSS